MSSDFDNRRHRHALVSALSIYLPIQVRCPAIQRMRDRCAAFCLGQYPCGRRQPCQSVKQSVSVTCTGTSSMIMHITEYL